MIYNRFDVVLVQFPFSEKRGRKQRPSIILTAKPFNAAHSHAVTAMVTTANNTVWPSDLPIADFIEAGLRVPSVMRMKLFTVSEDLILGRVGTLTPNDQRAVDKVIYSLFQE